MNRRRVTTPIAVGILLSFTASAAAEEGGFWAPRVEGALTVEVQNDNTVESDDSDSEINNLTNTTELGLDFYAADPLFLSVGFTLEPTLDPDPGDDCTFCRHGAYLDTLTLTWEDERWAVFGGKFAPDFSLAYDAAPGIYGADFAGDDLELTEFIGFGGSFAVVADEDVGTHTLSASAFFADTTFFSQSAFNNRGDTELGDGGPANTESPESFAVAVAGEEIAALPGFRYHISGAHLAVDRVFDEDGNAVADIDDERRFAVAGEWEIGLAEDLSLTPFAEYARLWNAGGVSDQDQDYATLGATLGYGGWNAAVSYTGRFIDNADGTDVTDTLFQVTAGYAFDFGLSIDAGYKLGDEGNIESHTVGVLLVYELEFGL